MELEYTSCNICDKDDTVILYRSDFIDNTDEMEDIAYNYSIGERQFRTGRIVKCKQCGLIYVNPRPADTKKRYENEKLDERYLKSLKQRMMTYSSDLAFIQKMRNGNLPGHFLDIGCSSGDFIYLAKNNGWDVSGIELNKDAYSIAIEKGLKVYNHQLTSIGFEGGMFDVVTLWGVLEHFSNPLSELSEIGRILKKGGLIFITTALMDTFFARVVGKKHPAFLGQHLYYFSGTTIRELLKKANLEIIKIVPHRQFLQCSYISESLERYNQSGRILGAIFKMPLLKNIFFNLSLFHIESTIVAVKRV